MRYWEGAEVEKSFYDSLLSIRKRLSAQISDILEGGKLAQSDVELCYIPIVMGPDFSDLYPPRTRFDSEERRLYHSPVLDYSAFQGDDEAKKVHEYIKGLLSAAPKLRAAGLAENQIIEYKSGLERVRNQRFT